MNMKKTIIYVSLIVSLVIPLSVNAAEISFESQENTVGLATPFLVSVNLSADVAVNAFDLSIRFPDGFEPVDISDGNSIVPMWIEHPLFDPLTHLLTLSGFIPGGYSGKDGRIVTLSIEAHRAGQVSISVDTQKSHMYRNNPPGIQEPISSSPLMLTADNAKNNVAYDIPDSYPPETFTPVVALLPTDRGDAWMLVFATQDKGSGIDHYEVREVNSMLPFLSTWHSAESPYLLTDQSLRSSIDIRAYDKKGNVREESVAQRNPTLIINLWLDIALVGLILGIAFIIRMLWRFV
jgi:hypothetical protein